MFVIGTAGHVDHGKSTLVEALTGIDPDRLAEEKEREMTIDLGFAWLRLGDEEVGVVDVPGHRDFIENMLAGISGIDLALLVIAADEGVMPQTREHLAILDLLEVDRGVVALTKTDMVDDEEWLELVTLEIGETLATTKLADAPIVPVSARTGQGIEALRATLIDHLQTTTARADNGRPRLPIDRVFSLPGFGTIVTGTLQDGALFTGQEVGIEPGGQSARIRGLQTHKTKRETAAPGSRVAINLTGVDRDALQRGQVVLAPGTYRSTILCDALYRHLPDADAPLRHNQEVKLFAGSAEVTAKCRIIGRDSIAPGETGWLQLALQAPISVARNDRFILRRPSPGATLGGGRVLDPYPGRRYRRLRPDTLARFEALERGSPGELLLQALERGGPATVAAAIEKAGLDREVGLAEVEQLLAGGSVMQVGKQLVPVARWQALHDEVISLLRQHHAAHPLRLGIDREELRNRLRLNPQLFSALIDDLAGTDSILATGTQVALPNHTITFTPDQQAAADQLLARLKRSGVNSPNVKDSRRMVGDDVYYALLDLGRLRQLSDDVVYDEATYDLILERVTGYLATNTTISAPEARDLLDTSRKYAIAILEHLDDLRITRRVGDDRELVPAKSS